MRAGILGAGARRLTIAPATALGFRLLRSPRGDYPWLVRGKGRVAGLLLRGLTPTQWTRLGRYEGAEYRLRTLRVYGAGGRCLRVPAFLPRARGPLGPPWSFADWSRRRSRKHLGQSRNMVPGWRR